MVKVTNCSFSVRKSNLSKILNSTTTNATASPPSKLASSVSSPNQQINPYSYDIQTNKKIKNGNSVDQSSSVSAAQQFIDIIATSESSDNTRSPLPRAWRGRFGVFEKKCENCQTNTSPEWRKGPGGHKTWVYPAIRFQAFLTCSVFLLDCAMLVDLDMLDWSLNMKKDNIYSNPKMKSKQCYLVWTPVPPSSKVTNQKNKYSSISSLLFILIATTYIQNGLMSIVNFIISSCWKHACLDLQFKQKKVNKTCTLSHSTITNFTLLWCTLSSSLSSSNLIKTLFFFQVN